MNKIWIILSALFLSFLATPSFAQPSPLVDRAPVMVKVSVSNQFWVETISVCNISGNSIPLKDIELDFSYAIPMPTNIWGEPWAAWRLSSQQNGQVVLLGGTPDTPALPSDPNCTNPLTIKFNAAPDAPAPTGPFVFKSAGAQPSGFGALTITLPNAPANGLPNPLVTVQGMGLNVQQMVAWGAQWKLTNLIPGSYTISASAVDNGSQFFTSNPMNVTVQNNSTVQALIQYQPVATGQVTVSLVNAPSAQVPVIFTGQNFKLTKTVSNNMIITLPVDTYSVSSTTGGTSGVANPNPLTIPNNTALTLTYQQSRSPLFVGYFQSSVPDSQVSDGSKTNLANLPSYVNIVNLAYMKPDAVYVKNSLSYTGTGLLFNFQNGNVLKQAITTLHQKNPSTRVLVTVGGPTYTNWSNLNAQAIADFVVDFGLDGVDINFQPATTGCALGGDELIHCQIDAAFQGFVNSLRTILPRPATLMVEGANVGAYGQDQWKTATPMNQFTGMMLPLLRSAAASGIDIVNVMSFDAGLTYDPNQALAAYSHYFPGVVSMGVEVPPEASGGHIYDICQVMKLTQAVTTSATQRNKAPGMMLFTIQKTPNGTPSANNPNAQMMATVICTNLGLANCGQPLLVNGLSMSLDLIKTAMDSCAGF